LKEWFVPKYISAESVSESESESVSESESEKKFCGSESEKKVFGSPTLMTVCFFRNKIWSKHDISLFFLSLQYRYRRLKH
jgi:hypothetical protein